MESLFFTNKLQRIMKEMGYSSDQDGIIDRYLREDQNWKEHLENTKNAIIEAAKTKSKTTAVVIGSGWWLDVPVEELSQMFSVVYLVDIRHPQQIQHKAKKFSNVQLIETDSSGFVEDVYNLVKAHKNNALLPDLQKLLPKNFNFGLPSTISPDFIVSVNILNQLNILICDYLKRKMKYSEEDLFAFAQKIQRVHLESLIPSKSILITDYEELLYDENSILIKTNPLVLIDLPEGTRKLDWKWNFDLSMRYYDNQKTIFNVVAIEF